MSEYNKELSCLSRHDKIFALSLEQLNAKIINKCTNATHSFSRRFDINIHYERKPSEDINIHYERKPSEDINMHYERKPSEDISFTVAVQW